MAERMAEDQEAEQMAEEHRERGNALFRQDRWQEALDEYSKGIELMPENHVLYSNRAAVLAHKAVARFEDALTDANHCVELSPTWVKGYVSRSFRACPLALTWAADAGRNLSVSR